MGITRKSRLVDDELQYPSLFPFYFGQMPKSEAFQEVWYHGDTLPPEFVFNHGLKAPGTSVDIYQHAFPTKGYTFKESGFINTHLTIDAAQNYPTRHINNFIYQVKPQKNAYDITHFLPKWVTQGWIDAEVALLHMNEFEMAVPGKIKGTDITGAWPIETRVNLDPEFEGTVFEELFTSTRGKFIPNNTLAAKAPYWISKGTYYAGRAFSLVATANDGYNLGQSIGKSLERRDPSPFLKETFRIASAWSGAAIGGAIGTGTGLFVGSPGGPALSATTSFVFGVSGAGLGYEYGSHLSEEAYKLIESQFTSDGPNLKYARNLTTAQLTERRQAFDIRQSPDSVSRKTLMSNQNNKENSAKLSIESTVIPPIQIPEPGLPTIPESIPLPNFFNQSTNQSESTPNPEMELNKLETAIETEIQELDNALSSMPDKIPTAPSETKEDKDSKFESLVLKGIAIAEGVYELQQLKYQGDAFKQRKNEIIQTIKQHSEQLAFHVDLIKYQHSHYAPYEIQQQIYSALYGHVNSLLSTRRKHVNNLKNEITQIRGRISEFNQFSLRIDNQLDTIQQAQLKISASLKKLKFSYAAGISSTLLKVSSVLFPALFTGFAPLAKLASIGLDIFAQHQQRQLQKKVNRLTNRANQNEATGHQLGALSGLVEQHTVESESALKQFFHAYISSADLASQEIIDAIDIRSTELHNDSTKEESTIKQLEVDQGKLEKTLKTLIEKNKKNKNDADIASTKAKIEAVKIKITLHQGNITNIGKEETELTDARKKATNLSFIIDNAYKRNQEQENREYGDLPEDEREKRHDYKTAIQLDHQKILADIQDQMQPFFDTTSGLVSLARAGEQLKIPGFSHLVKAAESTGLLLGTYVHIKAMQKEAPKLIDAIISRAQGDITQGIMEHYTAKNFASYFIAPSLHCAANLLNLFLVLSGHGQTQPIIDMLQAVHSDLTQQIASSGENVIQHLTQEITAAKYELSASFHTSFASLHQLAIQTQDSLYKMTRLINNNTAHAQLETVLKRQSSKAVQDLETRVLEKLQYLEHAASTVLASPSLTIEQTQIFIHTLNIALEHAYDSNFNDALDLGPESFERLRDPIAFISYFATHLEYNPETSLPNVRLLFAITNLFELLMHTLKQKNSESTLLTLHLETLSENIKNATGEIRNFLIFLYNHPLWVTFLLHQIDDAFKQIQMLFENKISEHQNSYVTHANNTRHALLKNQETALTKLLTQAWNLTGSKKFKLAELMNYPVGIALFENQANDTFPNKNGTTSNLGNSLDPVLGFYFPSLNGTSIKNKSTLYFDEEKNALIENNPSGFIFTKAASLPQTVIMKSPLAIITTSERACIETRYDYYLEDDLHTYADVTKISYYQFGRDITPTKYNTKHMQDQVISQQIAIFKSTYVKPSLWWGPQANNWNYCLPTWGIIRTHMKSYNDTYDTKLHNHFNNYKNFCIKYVAELSTNKSPDQLMVVSTNPQLTPLILDSAYIKLFSNKAIRELYELETLGHCVVQVHYTFTHNTNTDYFDLKLIYHFNTTQCIERLIATFNYATVDAYRHSANLTADNLNEFLILALYGTNNVMTGLAGHESCALDSKYMVAPMEIPFPGLLANKGSAVLHFNCFAYTPAVAKDLTTYYNTSQISTLLEPFIQQPQITLCNDIIALTLKNDPKKISRDAAAQSVLADPLYLKLKLKIFELYETLASTLGLLADITPDQTTDLINQVLTLRSPLILFEIANTNFANFSDDLQQFSINENDSQELLLQLAGGYQPNKLATFVNRPSQPEIPVSTSLTALTRWKLSASNSKTTRKDDETESKEQDLPPSAKHPFFAAKYQKTMADYKSKLQVNEHRR